MSEDHTLPFNTNALYGSVTDDDGVSGLWYQYADSDPASSDAGWTELTVTNGTFTLNFPEDGTKKLYFKVLDSGATATSASGTNFISSTSTTYSLNTPKLTDSGTTPNRYGYRGGVDETIPTVTYLTVDTKAP